jgi:hypothetical protein
VEKEFHIAQVLSRKKTMHENNSSTPHRTIGHHRKKTRQRPAKDALACMKIM